MSPLASATAAGGEKVSPERRDNAFVPTHRPGQSRAPTTVPERHGRRVVDADTERLDTRLGWPIAGDCRHHRGRPPSIEPDRIRPTGASCTRAYFSRIATEVRREFAHDFDSPRENAVQLSTADVTPAAMGHPVTSSKHVVEARRRSTSCGVSPAGIHHVVRAMYTVSNG